MLCFIEFEGTVAGPCSKEAMWKIKPYYRKHDPPAMKKVDEWTMKPFPAIEKIAMDITTLLVVNGRSDRERPQSPM
ncbi:hypothetical protein BHM03_00028094 [Ensete ventricosum]|nr:hypothetical protein BHM03_00028094 [Ensete ventricosum]